MSFRLLGYKLLFSGQRQAKGHHTCDCCGRSIGPGEFYWTSVRLHRLPESTQREIVQRKSCCGVV